MNGKAWSKRELAKLAKLYPNTPNQKLSKKFKRGIGSITSMAYLNGFKKSQEFLKKEASGRIMKGQSLGSKYWFKKGQTPANKGKKMSKATFEKVKDTMFKPGNKPANTKEGSGHLRISKSSKGNSVTVYIKIRDKLWVQLSRFNYEDYWGPLPPGYIVTFKDGDATNCAPENLIPITRKQNMQRNTIQRYPAEIKEVMRLNSKLKRIIKTKNEKQN